MDTKCNWLHLGTWCHQNVHPFLEQASEDEIVPFASVLLTVKSSHSAHILSPVLQLGPLEEDVLHQTLNANAATSLQRVTEIQSMSSVSFSSFARSGSLEFYWELKHKETELFYFAHRSPLKCLAFLSVIILSYTAVITQNLELESFLSPTFYVLKIISNTKNWPRATKFRNSNSINCVVIFN